MRSRVAVIYQRTINARNWIYRFWKSKGRFPDKLDIAMFDLEGIISTDVQRVLIIPRKGTLILTLNGESSIAGKRLTIEPVLEDGQLYWRCGGELARKYLPASCR